MNRVPRVVIWSTKKPESLSPGMCSFECLFQSNNIRHKLILTMEIFMILNAIDFQLTDTGLQSKTGNPSAGPNVVGWALSKTFWRELDLSSLD